MANNHTPVPSDFPENGPDDRAARRRRRHPESWINQAGGGKQGR